MVVVLLTTESLNRLIPLTQEFYSNAEAANGFLWCSEMSYSYAISVLLVNYNRIGLKLQVVISNLSYDHYELCTNTYLDLFSPPQAPAKPLTEAEKMRKVISELVDTEHTYVRHLAFLMKVRSIISSC